MVHDDENGFDFKGSKATGLYESLTLRFVLAMNMDTSTRGKSEHFRYVFEIPLSETMMSCPVRKTCDWDKPLNPTQR
eukprot:2112628-Amphidinium_carterae.1